MSTKVHVHLFYGADPRFYRPGDNIGCLYGYHHAESDEFRLTYSQDAREGKPVRLLRRALKALLGFDFIHTWRNRAEMLRSDVIWTHTEQEWLSAALMLLLSGRKAGAGASPLLLAQSVWLLDKWPSYGIAAQLAVSQADEPRRSVDHARQRKRRAVPALFQA